MSGKFQWTTSTGQKKYGLIKPSSKPKKAAKALKPASFFSMDDDDEDEDEGKNVNRAIMAQNLSSRIDRKTVDLHAQALKEDPNVFDYDGTYDAVKEEREKKAAKSLENRQGSVEKRQSRYIGGLLKQSKIREGERQRIYERQLLKERVKEDELYGDKERFVTEAYKKKLQEDRRWEEEDKRAEAVEEGRKGDMSGFYRNLLTNNIAMGSADVEKAATSAYTAGSNRPAGGSGTAESAAAEGGGEGKGGSAQPGGGGRNDQAEGGGGGGVEEGGVEVGGEGSSVMVDRRQKKRPRLSAPGEEEGKGPTGRVVGETEETPGPKNSSSVDSTSATPAAAAADAAAAPTTLAPAPTPAEAAAAAAEEAKLRQEQEKKAKAEAEAARAEAVAAAKKRAEERRKKRQQKS